MTHYLLNTELSSERSPPQEGTMANILRFERGGSGGVRPDCTARRTP